MVDPSIPVIAPPSALDLAGGGAGQSQAQTPAIAPPEAAQAPSLPPPQVAGAAQGLGAVDLNPFGEGEENLSRWTPELVQQSTAVIDRDIARAQRDAQVALAEQHSQRGTVGSSIESWSQQEMLTNLETERMRRLNLLNVEMANAYAQDRATAANIALQQRAQELLLLGMDRDDAFRQAQLEQQADQFSRSLDQQESQFGRGLEQQAGQFSRSLDQQESQFGRGLEQQESEFARSYGLNQQALAVEVDRLRQQAEQFGQDLDLRRASLDAEVNLRSQEIQQRAQQFGEQMSLEQARLQAQQEQFQASLDWQRDSLAQQIGLSREQLAQQASQFQAELGDRAASRAFAAGMQESEFAFMGAQNELNRLLQQGLARDSMQFQAAQAELDRAQQQWLQQNSFMFSAEQAELDRVLQQGLAQGSWEFQAAQSALDRAQQTALQTASFTFQADQSTQDRLLQSRALDLQQQGLDAEAAWRQADRDLELALTIRAEELTREGWSRDDAYRQSLYELDRATLSFQRDAQQQNAEIAQWDVYFRALSAWQQAGGVGDPPEMPKWTEIGSGSGATRWPGTSTGGTTNTTTLGDPFEAVVNEYNQSPSTLPPPSPYQFQTDYGYQLPGISAPSSVGTDAYGNPMPVSGLSVSSAPGGTLESYLKDGTYEVFQAERASNPSIRNDFQEWLMTKGLL